MAYHDSTTANGIDTSPSVAVPNGGGGSPLAADDIVILILTLDNAAISIAAGSLPSGFTEIAEVDNSLDGQTTWLGWKRLTGADTGSYTFGDLGDENDWVLNAIAFRGRHTTDPPVKSTDASSNSGNTSPVSITANGVTAVSGDDLCWVGAADVSATGIANVFTQPTDFTSAESGERAFSWAGAAYRNNVSAGATGSITGTLTLTSGTSGWVAWVVRIPSAADSVDDLLANDVQSTSNVTAPAIGQVHAILANDVQSTSNVTAPALAQVHALTAADVESTSEVTAPGLLEVTPLTAEDVESASEVSAPVLAQVHVLLAADVESASEVSAPTLTEGEHILFADDVQSTSEVSAPALTQVHALTATSVQSTSSVTAPALGGLTATRTRIVRNIRPTRYVPEKSPYDSDPKLRVYIERELQAVARALGQKTLYTRTEAEQDAGADVDETKPYGNILRYYCPTDGASDCTPALDVAIASVGFDTTYGAQLYFPAIGTIYNFTTQPASITRRIRLRGDGKIGTSLVRAFSPASADLGLFNARLTGEGMIIEDLSIRSATGTSGGCLVSMVSDSTNNVAWGQLRNVNFSSTGSDTHLYAVHVDGSAKTADPVAVRLLMMAGCEIFGGASGSVLLKSTMGARLVGCNTFDAGGTTGKIVIAGTASVPNYYTRIDGGVIHGIDISNSLYTMVDATAILGDVVMASTALDPRVDGFCTGSVTDNATYAVKSVASLLWGRNVRADQVQLGTANGPLWARGSGSPEGAVAAPVGSLFSRTDGGAGTSLYVKQAGTGNTGWAAVTP